MIAKIYSAIPQGYDGQLVEVEGDASRSLPSFNIVGMANKTISESRERVRAAIASSGFRFPDKRVTVNLAPAELAKDGTHLDLPIALAVLVLSKQLLPGDLHGRLFVGELSLDGQTKPIRGIINIVETALAAGFTEIYIPVENLPQATLVPHATIIGVDSLESLFLHLKGARPLSIYRTDKLLFSGTDDTNDVNDANDANNTAENSKNLSSSPVHKNHQLNTNFSAQTPSTPVIPHVAKNNCSGVARQNPHPASDVVKNTETDNSIINLSTRASKTPPSNNVVEITKTDNTPVLNSPVVKNTPTDTYLLDDIRGQTLAKRALIIAIAGNHNLLLSGPPGSGKTLLARVAHSLLPPPSPVEQVEIAKLYSLISTSAIPTTRPFRNPHHTASTNAIIGGSAAATPGEISLAHRGILFLDEIPEYARPVLEALRQPLEDRQITISRTRGHATYPADFMLIATMNPCPCGHLDDPSHPCTCLPTQILNYQKRLSGPILDRIDLTLHVKRLPSQDLLPSNTPKATSEHSAAQSQILAARARQAARYGDPRKSNASLSSSEISRHLTLSSTAENLLQTAADKLNLSARGYFKVIKVAQTIADLDASDLITPEYIAEALTFRHQAPSLP